MGEGTKIEWADHTFNPWVGCAKVSPACTNCYAESWAKRTGRDRLWRGERKRTTPANWKKPLKWNRETPGARVFCSSLADVFEEHPSLPEWRRDLYELIEATPDLTWLLLTKRPENVRIHVPERWLAGGWPSHVWIGTTVENQQRADERIPFLLDIPAPVRFLSMEPLLGPVDLGHLWRQGWSWPVGLSLEEARSQGLATLEPFKLQARGARRIDWVIAGGESGSNARPSHPDWFRSLRDQCRSAGIPFHFKQWGEWAPGASGEDVFRVGKSAAGRMLDGCTHDGLPASGASSRSAARTTPGATCAAGGRGLEVDRAARAPRDAREVR